jgi:hypothetical protein
MPTLALATVEHQRHRCAELGAHVRGRGRADAPEAVGRGRGEAAAEGAQQFQRERMRRAAQADAVLAAGTTARHAAAARQDQRQRPGQKACASALRRRRHVAAEIRAVAGAGDVHDQRMVRGPALEREDLRDAAGIAGIGGEAVDGFGRHADHLAAAQRARPLRRCSPPRVTAARALLPGAARARIPVASRPYSAVSQISPPRASARAAALRRRKPRRSSSRQDGALRGSTSASTRRSRSVSKAWPSASRSARWPCPGPGTSGRRL